MTDRLDGNTDVHGGGRKSCDGSVSRLVLAT